MEEEDVIDPISAVLLFLPLGLVLCGFVFPTMATLVALIVSSIPALITTLPIWLVVGVVFFALPLFVFAVYAKTGEKVGLDEDEVDTSLTNEAVSKLVMPVFLVLLQFFTVAGILSFVQYPTLWGWYGTMWDKYWEAFELPPFNWDWYLSWPSWDFYFTWPAWERIFTLNLYACDIFGACLASQFLFSAADLVMSAIPTSFTPPSSLAAVPSPSPKPKLII